VIVLAATPFSPAIASIRALNNNITTPLTRFDENSEKPLVIVFPRTGKRNFGMVKCNRFFVLNNGTLKLSME